MKRFLQGLGDLIFPPRCMACGVLLTGPEEASFCNTCLSDIRLVVPPLCPCCGIPLAGAGENHLCGDCLVARPPYSTARAFARYEAALYDVIHAFKYKGEIRAGKVLGKMMAAQAYADFSIDGHDLIVPVPLHPRRLRERGFNQAVILAREISRCFSIPMDFWALRRRVFTEPQVSLGKAQRGTNVRGAFAVRDAAKLDGRRIILVDDVYTTGSTVKECAETLLKNGAKDVAVLTLARAL